jgi:hypothetical protein
MDTAGLLRRSRLLLTAILILGGGVGLPATPVTAIPLCSLWNPATSQNEVDSEADLITLGTDVICADADIVQIADITLTASPWYAIPEFTGSYDGNGHSITGLSLDGTLLGAGPTSSNGLFDVGGTGASFTDLRIGVTASGSSNYVGALVGYSRGPLTITNVHVTGNLAASFYVGGLVGFANGSVDIRNSSHTGNVNGDSYVAGIIAEVGGSEIILDGNSSSGLVVGTGNNVGGMIGSTSTSGVGTSISITDSTRSGNVTGNAYVGGLIGQTGVHSVTANDNTVTGNVAGRVAGGNYIGGIIGTTTSGGTGTQLDMHRNVVTGDVTGDDAYVGGIIASTGYFVVNLTNNRVDGDVIGTRHSIGGIIGTTSSGGSGTSLTITDSTRNGDTTGEGRVGGVIGQTGVNVITANDNTVTGDTHGTDQYVGGVIGTTSSGGDGTSLTLSRNSIVGSISGDAAYVGGLVGQTGVNTTIAVGNRVEGNVLGVGDYVGGIIGTTSSGGTGTSLTITDSTRIGNVTGGASVGGVVGRTGAMVVTFSSNTLSGSTTGTGDFVGGVIGWTTSGGDGTSLTVSNSSVVGSTTGSGNYVGGVTGSTSAASVVANDTTVHGDVSVTYNYAGGLFGWTTSGGSGTSLLVTDVDYRGDIGGTSNLGGLVGTTSSETIRIERAVVEGTVAGSGTDVGGLIGATTNFGSDVDLLSISRVGNVNGDGEIGGFVGDMFANMLSIAGVSVTGNVTGSATNTGSWVGGLVGRLSIQDRSTIDETFVIGDVSGYDFVGGLIGQAGFATLPSVTIDETFYLGSVSGTDTKVGGLVGLANHALVVRSSFARASVSGSSEVGGMTGNLFGDMTLDRSYFQGDVTATSDEGSFVGTGPVMGMLSIADSYCTDADCPQSHRVDVEELKSPTFLAQNSWDMVGTWCVRTTINSGFPILRTFTYGPLDASICAPQATPIFRVTLNANGGSCVDGANRTGQWTTVFVGYRYLPVDSDCTRPGHVLAGWADVSNPDVSRTFPVLVDPTDGIRRSFIAENADLVAVWTAGPPPISDLVVFANFLCGPCTNAWLIYTMPPTATDVEISLDETPTACFRQGEIFGLSLCEITFLSPGDHSLTVTPRREDVEGLPTSQRFTLRS